MSIRTFQTSITTDRLLVPTPDGPIEALFLGEYENSHGLEYRLWTTVPDLAKGDTCTVVPHGWKPTASPHPGQLQPAQRFDRDAVKAMLADAMNACSDSCFKFTVEGSDINSDDASGDRHWTETFDGDRLADAVIEWFGGKGAA